MPAYNFQPRFADAVESGAKTQTIRKTRRGAKPGDTAYLYTGQRTKACRKIGEGRLISVFPISIDRIFGAKDPAIFNHTCRQLTQEEADFFAQLDGFEDAQALYKWFDENHGLPFTGYVHKWILK